MNYAKESLKNWFGFTRKERRSTFILLIIILMVIGVRFVVPQQNITIEEIPPNLKEFKSESVAVPENFAVTGKQKEIKTVSRQKPLLEINSCDSALLVSLPGIGPVLSARIVKYRNLIGGFAKIDQLKEVYGLNEETFNLISGRIYADSLALRKIMINEAGYKDLIRHPYFQKSEVSGILKYRELKGKIFSITDLLGNNIISFETGEKIKPYLDFGK